MVRDINGRLLRINREEYAGQADALNHLFLVGDLKKPTLHPFVRDARLEMVVCNYQAGDRNPFHWHQAVTEYNYVIEGELIYFEVGAGETQRLRAGDFFVIPAGLCVGLKVDQPARAITIKVPSLSEKILCRDCQRDCAWRIRE